MFVIVHTIR